jgi:hypothetical protein
MPRFCVPRMQTNAASVSPPISFVVGAPAQLVDLTAWTLDGTARSSTACAPLDVRSGWLVLAGNDKLMIYLDEADMAALGSGRVDVELLRVAPTRRWPLLPSPCGSSRPHGSNNPVWAAMIIEQATSLGHGWVEPR